MFFTIRKFGYRFKRKIIKKGFPLIWGLPSVNLDDIIPENFYMRIDPPILEDICLPPYYVSADHDDFTPLMKIVKALQPRVVVELGTGYGNLTANVCNQSSLTKVYTVNAPAERQTGVITTYCLTEHEIGRVYRKYGFGNRVVQLIENTMNLDLSQYFSELVIDLGIIDACHDTEFVINDFLKVEPFVRKGGIVLFHDTHPSMAMPNLTGSYIGCMMLRRYRYDIRHIRDTWWGIWRKA